MSVFTEAENRVKCGRCLTEFDLNKNPKGCPLCGFGSKDSRPQSSAAPIASQTVIVTKSSSYGVPPALNLKPGKVLVTDDAKIWGAPMMYNDYFAPKFLMRRLAWLLHQSKKEYITVQELLDDALQVIRSTGLENGLCRLKGFPSLHLDKKYAGSRMIYILLFPATDMGFFELKAADPHVKDYWRLTFDKILVTLTKEGLEFAQLRNVVFDDGSVEQVLTPEERAWLLSYLKKLDKQGYNEYEVLHEVYSLLKKGKNGNTDLWTWFENNKTYQQYIKKRSERARKDTAVFKKQLENFSRTFASSKISLLREFGVVKDKRNDYSIVGDIK